MISRRILAALLLPATLQAAAIPETASPMILCRGACDASAVAFLDGGRFVVADDEDNVLRVYSRTHGGAPLASMDLSAFLQVSRESPEVDLEGAASLDGRVYWVSSHARNRSGKERPSRHRFFATTLSTSNGVTTLAPVGIGHCDLLPALLADPRLKPFGVAAASRRAPKSKNALNIEGLCATPEGHLLLGFRNPIPDGGALVVPLLNPAEVVGGAAARLGDPVQIPLEGLGIRSMTRLGRRYYIVAGPFDGSGQSLLYEWGGEGEAPRRLLHPELKGLNPEAIEVLPLEGIARLLVVSDDGSLKVGGQECKDLKDANLKCFRATVVDL